MYLRTILSRFTEIITIFILILIFSFDFASLSLAGPQSTTYELKEYGFGSGGDSGINSTNYSLFGAIGETDVSTASSTTYNLGGGLISTLLAAVPPGPVVANPGNTYDRLQIIVNTGGNPTDTLYAISISDGTTTRYVQNDYTMGAVLGTEDWLLYSGGVTVGWGGGSGFYVTNLTNNKTYTIFVKAKQGAFTESSWGPGVTGVTSDPSFTFGVDASTITFSNLNAGNSYTDSSKTTIITTSTNAYNGYLVYGYETQPLTHTANSGLTIANYAGTNATPMSWTGTGFGYTTNDSSLIGGTANRFTNAGPNFAGFTTVPPGDPVADHPGPIVSPISNESFTITYRVTASSTTNAGQYRTTVLYIAVPTY